MIESLNTCRSCGAPILWRETHAGKRMSIDPEPHPDGNVVIEGEIAEVLKAEHLARLGGDVLRYRSHFVTCANAATHRRK